MTVSSAIIRNINAFPNTSSLIRPAGRRIDFSLREPNSFIYNCKVLLNMKIESMRWYSLLIACILCLQLPYLFLLILDWMSNFLFHAVPWDVLLWIIYIPFILLCGGLWFVIPLAVGRYFKKTSKGAPSRSELSTVILLVLVSVIEGIVFHAASWPTPSGIGFIGTHLVPYILFFGTYAEGRIRRT